MDDLIESSFKTLKELFDVLNESEREYFIGCFWSLHDKIER
jgi:hypothetical protein